MQIDRYFDAIVGTLEDVRDAQREKMLSVAHLFADTVRNGSTIFITGCSHSSIFAQEVFYRAGGFMLINPLFLPGMTLESPPPTLTSKMERISGIAECVLSESAIRPGDTLVIASISGRNVVPIEMAVWARAHRVQTVALTSMRYSEAVPSRHSSGKRLCELTDYALDVMAPPGDAALDIKGLPVRTAPISTITGITILHSVIAQTIELLLSYGITPPVFMSANLDDGDDHNSRLLRQYRDRIHYM